MITMPMMNIIFKFKSGTRLMLFSTKPQISCQNENSVFGQLQRLDFYKYSSILHCCKKDSGEKDVGEREKK